MEKPREDYALYEILEMVESMKESIGGFHLYTSNKEYLKGKRCGACKESPFLLGEREGVFAAS